MQLTSDQRTVLAALRDRLDRDRRRTAEDYFYAAEEVDRLHLLRNDASRSDRPACEAAYARAVRLAAASNDALATRQSEVRTLTEVLGDE